MYTYKDLFPQRNVAIATHISEVLNKLRQTSPAAYGGEYFIEGDLDTLHVNVVAGLKPLELESDPTMVQFHEVKYSVSDLDRIQD